MLLLMLLSGATVGAQAADGAVDPFVLFRAPSIALVHAQLIDGTGAPIRDDQTVIIRGERITAVGDFATTPVPQDALLRDLKGAALAPGLVLLHEHLFYPLARAPNNYGSTFGSFPALYLAGGVTLMRTAGSLSPYADLNTRRDIDAGAALGPDIDVTAPYIEGNARVIEQLVRLESPADAERLVDYWAKAGTTSYKGYMHLTRAQLAAAIRAAHAHGQKITAHLCSITYAEAAELGIDNLEHGFAVASDFVADKRPDDCPAGDTVGQSLDALAVDDPRMPQLQQRLLAKHVAITSTLTVFETFAFGRPMAPAGALELLIPQLREQYVAGYSRIAGGGPNLWSRVLAKDMVWEKQFHDAGGLLVAGTDPTGYGGVVPGYSAMRQVELLIEAGFEVPEAFRIVSLNGAIYLGREASVGSVAAGKRADLVAFAKPLDAKTTKLPEIAWTMKAGTAFDRAAILASWRGRVGLQ